MEQLTDTEVLEPISVLPPKNSPRKAFYQNPWLWVGILGTVSVLSLGTAGYALIHSPETPTTTSASAKTSANESKSTSSQLSSSADNGNLTKPEKPVAPPPAPAANFSGPIHLKANCQNGPCLAVIKGNSLISKKNFSGSYQYTLDDSYNQQPIIFVVKSLNHQGNTALTCEINQGSNFQQKQSAAGNQAFVRCVHSLNGENDQKIQVSP